VDPAELLLFVALVVVAALGGLALGIVVVAPRLTRFANRDDEDPGARPD
jgi:hypothetical protein